MTRDLYEKSYIIDIANNVRLAYGNSTSYKIFEMIDLINNFDQASLFYGNKLISCTHNSAVTIGSSAFAMCGTLTFVEFPECTTINQSAFYNCGLLSTAIFSKCTNINQSAFYNCSLFSSLYIGTSNCVLSNTNAFFNTPISTGAGLIYVPAAYVETYKNSVNWSAYSSKIVSY